MIQCDQFCCDRMTMQYVGQTYIKKKMFAKDVKCLSCNCTGTDFFDIDQGTQSKPLFTRLNHD